MTASVNPAGSTPPASRWQRWSRAWLRAFHAYASWLVSISWWKFFGLALLLLITMGILHDNPPFTWTITDTISQDEDDEDAAPAPPKPPKPPKPPGKTSGSDFPIRIETGRDGKGDVDITIGREGIRIKRVERAASAATPAAAATASAAASSPPVAASAGSTASPSASSSAGINIKLPPGPVGDAVREAVREVIEDIQRDAEQAVADAKEAQLDAEAALESMSARVKKTSVRKRRIGIGDMLMQLTVLFIFTSAIVKGTYKSKLQAERQAAQANETAEAESLKRQVVEARMAAMQAQVEPHFLFNTLASIEHLIETDPPRASQMQRNLIALLRASMPTLRETRPDGNGHAKRDLKRELEVIRPYLEILKVRMEERLHTRIEVPDGLLSAEFPAMMIQTLVENAIKHGLEPKPEGGELVVRAAVVHGKLQVSVADTGLGFGRAATAGTGVGLANIRDRLQLLYGQRAQLSVTENAPSGTVVSISIPYTSIEPDGEPLHPNPSAP